MEQNQKHKNEMIRLANSPEGTHIWWKHKTASVWLKYASVLWLRDFDYIVDDCHQELRRLAIDDPSAEFECKGDQVWYTITNSPAFWDVSLDYRKVVREDWVNGLNTNNILCWVSNIDDTERVTIRVITNINGRAFEAVNDYSWKYATPVLESDLSTCK